MAIHFEELWEKCEHLHQQIGGDTSVASITDELAMKINLYKVIDSKSEIPVEDKKEAKARTMGEILLTLTHLSLRDDINVFEVLSVAQQYRNNEFVKTIPPEFRLPTKK